MASQFGQLIEAIVGAVTGTILDISAAADLVTTNRYLSALKRSEKQQEQAAQVLEAQKNELTQTEASNQATQTQVTIEQMNKLAIVIAVVVIGVTVVGFCTFYYVSVKGDA